MSIYTNLTTKLSRWLLLAIFSISVLSSLAFAENSANKQVLPIQHWTTKNGAEVYYVHTKELPLIDVQIAFAAGSDRDGKSPGLANFTGNTLDEGTQHLSADEIAAGFENLGAKYDIDTSKEMTLIALRSLTKPELLNPALNLFSQLLSQPSFPNDNFKRVQKNTLSALQAQQQSPETIATQEFFKALYNQSPYAQPILGNPNSVAAITPQQVKQFYDQYYVSKNAVIAMVGDVDELRAQQIAEQITQNLPHGNKAIAIQPLQNTTSKTVTIKYPSNQTYIRLGDLGISPHAKNYFPLIVGNYILGSGMVSRLFKEVREQRGLSYGIYSYFQPMSAKGPFLVSLQTRNNQTQQALDITKQVLQKYISGGPTQDELTAAKQNILGSFPLRFASNSDIASIILQMGFYHLPFDYLDTYRANVEKVTTTDIQKAFQEIINPNKLITVVVGGNNLS